MHDEFYCTPNGLPISTFRIIVRRIRAANFVYAAELVYRNDSNEDELLPQSGEGRSASEALEWLLQETADMVDEAVAPLKEVLEREREEHRRHMEMREREKGELSNQSESEGGVSSPSERKPQSYAGPGYSNDKTKQGPSGGGTRVGTTRSQTQAQGPGPQNDKGKKALARSGTQEEVSHGTSRARGGSRGGQSGSRRRGGSHGSGRRS